MQEQSPQLRKLEQLLGNRCQTVVAEVQHLELGELGDIIRNDRDLVLVQIEHLEL